MADEKKVEEKKNSAAPAKAVTAVKKDENAKLPFHKRIAKWFREMKSELKKVIWPTKKQLINNTGISLVVMLVSALGIWVFDQLAQALVNVLITLAA